MKSELETQIIGIIPAAGKGNRLAPFPCPKELFPIGYQDYLEKGILQKRPKVISQYLIENIIGAGTKRLFIILGEDKYDIMRYYGDGNRFGVDIAYLFQDKLYGMPYAINLARSWVSTETVIFGMPDTIIEPKDAFQKLLRFHQGEKCDLTLGLFPTENPSKFGMVELDGQNNVTYIVDKPKETKLKFMWGCACWSPSFQDLIGKYIYSHPYSGKEIVLGDIFQEAIESKMTVKALKFKDGQYIDIGTTTELDSALRKFHL
jgi:glucose-1-phosphate thymidylyltransferase